jgi:hypothetical protein
VRAFKLANGEVIELNNASVGKSLREKLRDSACAHAVNLPRHDAPRNPKEVRTRVASAAAVPLATPASGYAGEQAVKVGPWTITAAYKGDRFEDCSMSRSAEELGVMFFRAEDGLALLLDSDKWKLERGKVYMVRLVAGSHWIEARAIADDGALNSRLPHASILEVRGEGATLRVPLDGSAAALRRMEACFDKNSRAGVETNPFVAHSRRP